MYSYFSTFIHDDCLVILVTHLKWNASISFWMTDKKKGFLSRLNRSLQIFLKTFCTPGDSVGMEMIYIPILITILWQRNESSYIRCIHCGWFIDGRLYKLALSSEASIEPGNLANCTFEETKAIPHVGW